MDTTNSSENQQRRVEDRKPAEVIDWAAPGAPAVPLSPAATSGTDDFMVYGRAGNRRADLEAKLRDALAADTATASGDELPPLPKAAETLPLLPGATIASRERYTTDQVIRIRDAAFEAGKRAAVSAATKPTAHSVDLGGHALNDAGWALVEALPHDSLTSNGFNNLKPALRVAIEKYLSLVATKPAAAPAVPGGQTIIGKLLDQFSNIEHLWGLNEPGALVRQRDVFNLLIAAGKELAATPAASTTGAAQTAEEDALDAARYRFLRKGFGDMGPDIDLHNAFVDGDEKMDAAIDAAMARPTPTHSSEAGDA